MKAEQREKNPKLNLLSVKFQESIYKISNYRQHNASLSLFDRYLSRSWISLRNEEFAHHYHHHHFVMIIEFNFKMKSRTCYSFPWKWYSATRRYVWEMNKRDSRKQIVLKVGEQDRREVEEEVEKNNWIVYIFDVTHTINSSRDRLSFFLSICCFLCISHTRRQSNDL